MPKGGAMVELARQHIGEEYQNVQVPKNNANWRGPWDCAEFMSWLVFQESEILYGCFDGPDPALVEAYTGAWQTDSKHRGIRIAVNKAAAIEGAFLLRFPPAPGRMGHIAISDGQAGTVEAKSRREGVVADTARGRRWDTGILVPGVTYDEDVEPISLGPVRVIRMGANNDPEIVRRIQRALEAAGIDPGGVDGRYGPKTTAAVAAFQRVKQLVVDGEVGPQTARELGIEL